MKKENIRQKRGITLIALVITIIIMLILIGVTITIAIKGGLLNYAKEAKAAHERTAEKEAIELMSAELKIKKFEEYGIDIESDLSDEIRNLIQNNGKQVGVVQDSSDKYNYIITFQETNDVFHYNVKTEKISEQGKNDGKDDNIELTEANIEIHQNPTTWTNGSITVTMSMNVEEHDMSNYILQYSTDNINWNNYTETIVVNEIVKIYGRIKNKITGQVKAQTEENITKLDTNLPIINSVTADESLNSITIIGQDTAKTGENISGINGYYYSTTNTAPTLAVETVTEENKQANKWVTFNASETNTTITKVIEGLNYNTTYYVWYKDQAGNISSMGSATTATRMLENPLIMGTITGSVVASSTHQWSNEGAIGAFDNDYTTWWLGKMNETETSLTYTFNDVKTINKIEFQVIKETENPKAILGNKAKIEILNELDQWETVWEPQITAENIKTKLSKNINETKAKAIRYSAPGGTHTDIYDYKYVSCVELQAYQMVEYVVGETKIITGNHAGNAVASSTHQWSNEGAIGAFDNNYATWWLGNMNDTQASLTYTFNNVKTVNKIQFQVIKETENPKAILGNKAKIEILNELDQWETIWEPQITAENIKTKLSKNINETKVKAIRYSAPGGTHTDIYDYKYVSCVELELYY